MSAKSVCDQISFSQGHEFLQALVRAGLTSAMAQRVIESLGNQKALAMLAALQAVAPVETDDRFKLAATFTIVVPEGYDHATQLDSFRQAHGAEFAFYNEAITDGNFAKATTQLVPGRKMQIKVFQITHGVSSEDCLQFLEIQKAILTGAQGASLVFEQAKEKLPKGRWHVSFDKKATLWYADGYHRVPDVYAHSHGDFSFVLGYFENDWRSDYCLLCFCDLPAEAAAQAG